MAGRLGAVAILPRVRHSRLLLGSVLAALFGCLILYFTNNGFGAATGAFFLGADTPASIPLVAEAIGRRFPVLPPRILQRHFLLGAGGRAAGAGHAGIRGVCLGRGSGDGNSADWAPAW